MKKICLSIITMLYMMISSGIAMEIHYCMGRKAGVDFYKTATGKCGRCGMKEKKKGCCNDEHRFYKLNDTHQNVWNSISFETNDAFSLTNHFLYDCRLYAAPAVFLFHDHPPPDDTGPSSCILHCVFRI